MLKKFLQSLALSFGFCFCLPVFSQSLVSPKVSAVFVLDQSGSVSDPNFLLQRDGFKAAIQLLPTSGLVEVSVIYFDTSVSSRVGLTLLDASGQVALLASLSPRTAAGGTATELAINAAANVLASAKGKTKFIFLSTDGLPNNTVTANSAAVAAKSQGIKIEPIGVGLNSSGQTFLNNISSSPPAPNPSNFSDFSIVVRNKISAAIGSALNVAAAPAKIEFGSISSIESAGKSSRIVNNGDSQISISAISLQGRDKDNFILKSIGGRPLSLPFNLPARTSVDIVLATKLLTPSATGDYSATLSVSATDGGTSDTLQIAVAAKAGDLDVTVMDARELIDQASSDGSLFSSGSLADEFKFAAVKSPKAVNGFVADGNSRLLIRVKTAASGAIRVKINSGKTSGKFFATNASSQGVTSIVQNTVQVENSGQTPNQATVAFKAGLTFSAGDQDPLSDFELEVCLVNLLTNSCSQTKTVTLSEKRAPVILIHGLWASAKSFEDTWTSEGLLSGLRQRFYSVDTYSYDSADDDGKASAGPSLIMPSGDKSLASRIEQLCKTEISQGFACTRVSIVGHSMGGLVARKFILDNSTYKTPFNFNAGAVSRLVTMGTPHTGSGLANLLTSKLSCVDQTKVAKLVERLESFGYKVRTAIADLAEGSDLLKSINAQTQVVPTFAVVGDVGLNVIRLPYIGALSEKFVKGQTGCGLADVFRGQNTDGIVPAPSARGRVGSFFATLGGVQHTGMGQDPAMIKEVLSRINLPEDKVSNVASLMNKLRNEAKPIFAQMVHGAQSLVLALLGVTSAYAADEISLSASTLSPSPNSTLILTASVSGVVDPDFGVQISDETGSSKQFSVPPYIWSMTLPGSAAGKATFRASAIVGGALVSSPPVVITVRQDLTAVTGLNAFPATPLSLLVGSRQQLAYKGAFADGFTRDVTGSASLQYKLLGLDASPSSGVISIGADGVVVALAAGVVDVVASLNGKIETRRISVEPVPEYLREIPATTPSTTGTTASTPGSSTGSGGGGGCVAGTAVGIDPTLYILVVFAAVGLLGRRLRRGSN